MAGTAETVDVLAANLVFDRNNHDLSLSETLKNMQARTGKGPETGRNFLGWKNQLSYGYEYLFLQNLKPGYFIFGKTIVVLKSYAAKNIIRESGCTAFKCKQFGVVEDETTQYLFNPDTREICVYTPEVRCFSQDVLYTLIGDQKERQTAPQRESSILVKTEVFNIVAPSANRILKGKDTPSDTLDLILNKPGMYPGVATYDKIYLTDGSFYQSPKPKELIVWDLYENIDSTINYYTANWIKSYAYFNNVPLKYVPLSTFEEWKKVGSSLNNSQRK